MPPTGKLPAMAKLPAGKKPAPARKITTRPTPKKTAPATVRARPPVKPKAKPKVKSIPPKVLPTPPTLNEKQLRFTEEYLVDLNATQAAIRAGYSRQSAGEQAHDLLKKPQIQAEIAAGRKRQQERTEVEADRALMEAWLVAIADARELVQVKVGCCRSCHGEGHKHQRTVAEMNHDMDSHLKEGKPAADFDEKGGIGFDSLMPPHPSCPECGGDGHARVVLMDTRDLSPAARALYAGAKQTKFGTEVQMHSKMDALEKVFKHLGLYEKDNSQKIDPLTSLLHTIASGNNSSFKPVARDPDHDEAK